MREPKSDWARYAFGYTDKKPGWKFWAFHALLVVIALCGVFGVFGDQP